MIDQILFLLYGVSVLLFGVFISAAFSGIKFNRKNIFICFLTVALSGLLQLIIYIVFGEEYVWKWYPLISHLPVFLLLYKVFYKKPATAAASVFTAYLCCQPSKWFSVLVFNFTQSVKAQYISRIFVIIAVAILIFFFFKDYVAHIYSKDSYTVNFLSITPMVYYLYDYATVVYSDVFNWDNAVISEFLPFMLCIVFMVFCIVYYKEYRDRSAAELNEQIVKIMLDEQKKELDTVKRSEHEIRLIRHDMRLLLNNLAVCIDNNDSATAKKLISAYIDNVESTIVRKYCDNNTLNYIISSFADKCHEQRIDFACRINIEKTECDEVMLAGIISNALDNAVNAQQYLPQDRRRIQFMLKQHNGRLLMSVRNPFDKEPVFVDGIPVSDRKGHGYGVQSIAYLSEKMGGNCQFTVEDNNFVLRVII